MIAVNCNLCGRDSWRLRFPATTKDEGPNISAFRCTSPSYGNHAQIVQCRHCGLVYANPRWSAAELEAAYATVEDETYVNERGGREITFQKHLQALERYTGPANGRALLDVGAYIGVFVEMALESGWHACGVEPSHWAVAHARQRGLNIWQGTQATPKLASRQFDVLTMWDVIEHFADPAAEISRAYTLLRPGGWLAVHTMDIDSPLARLMGRRWPWLMDMHLYYFSRPTLAALLKKSGFEVIWMGAQGRYLSLGYLATRLGGISAFLGKAAARAVTMLRLQDVAVPVSFGDLFTVFARRPSS